MAIQFNLNALSKFSNVNFGDNDAIANLDNGNGLVQNEKLGFILTRKFRSADAERQNNAVRTELLKALANAFGIKDGIAVANGKTTFTDKFMSRLEEILGPEFKRGDFGIKDGVVDSGKPLTQRRIKAIFKAAATAKADATAYDGKTYLAKADAIVDWFKKERLPDALSTKTGIKFFANVRRMIEFVESDFDGLAEVYANGDKDDLEKCKNFISRKIGLIVSEDEIADMVPKKARWQDNHVGEIINIDDVSEKTDALKLEKQAQLGYAGPEKDIDQIKMRLKQDLERTAKLAVDLCLKEKDSDEIEDLMEVIFNNDFSVSAVMKAMEKYANEHPDPA